MILRQTVILGLSLLLGGGLFANPPVTDEIPELTLQWYLADGRKPPDQAEVVVDEGIRYFRKTFQLPEDCELLEATTVEFGADGDGHFLRQLNVAEAACSLASFLELGVPTARLDFVSTSDFTDLPLDLIPHEFRCRGVHNDLWWDFCERVERNDPTVCVDGHLDRPLTYASYIAHYDETERTLKLRCDVRRVDTESCKLSNSEFTGSFEIRNDTVVCIPDSSDSGVQLYDVSFRDVNRDGVMDAVLSVGELRGGTAPRALLQFVVTRHEPDAPLVRLDGYVSD